MPGPPGGKSGGGDKGKGRDRADRAAQRDRARAGRAGPSERGRDRVTETVDRLLGLGRFATGIPKGTEFGIAGAIPGALGFGFSKLTKAVQKKNRALTDPDEATSIISAEGNRDITFGDSRDRPRTPAKGDLGFGGPGAPGARQGGGQRSATNTLLGNTPTTLPPPTAKAKPLTPTQRRRRAVERTTIFSTQGGVLGSATQVLLGEG